MAKYHSERRTERGICKLRYLRENDGFYVTEIFLRSGSLVRMKEKGRLREARKRDRAKRKRERLTFFDCLCLCIYIMTFEDAD